ncbi:lipase family protein [Nocardia sp. SSK8]|uniref:lipase family protein n=1 Tax=Nocardia sp. SSK8 TaxID=3120154 RepID=UPI003008722C
MESQARAGRSGRESRRERRGRWGALVVSALVGLTTLAAGQAGAEVADDFYTPPAGYAATAPGTVLDSRPVVAKLLQQFPIDAQAWQLLYRTTDGEGGPYAAVTTVLMPRGPARPRPLLSFQMAYDALRRECMPSYSLTHGSLTDLLDTAKQSGRSTVPSEAALVATALSKGWAVSVPDPGGVEDRFLTPRLMGYTVLDGIRAAENFAPLGLPGAATRVAGWGYSGGGVATSWAAEVQPRYAPELNAVGFAIGAPVQDLEAAIHTADGRSTVGLVPLGLASISKDSPEFAQRLAPHLTPAGRDAVELARVSCTATTVGSVRFRRVSDWLEVPVDQLMADPVIRREVEIRKRGSETPTAPLYVLNGLHDEVSNSPAVDALVDRWCAAGASITQIRDAVPDSPMGAHGVVALTGAGGLLAWLDRALTGDGPVQGPGCTVRTVTSTALEPEFAQGLPEFASAILGTLLGQALGAGR